MLFQISFVGILDQVVWTKINFEILEKLKISMT